MTNDKQMIIKLTETPEVQRSLMGTKCIVELPDGRKAECLVLICPIATMHECTPGTRTLDNGEEKTTKLDGFIAGSNGWVNFSSFGANSTFIVSRKSNNSAISAFK